MCHRPLRLVFASLAFLAFHGCGGEAVVPVGLGAGGTSDAATGDSSGDASADQTPDGQDCEELKNTLGVLAEEALLCDPGISAIQCSNDLLIHNRCGCMVAANLLEPDKAAAAEAAYDRLVATACFAACPAPCAPPAAAWSCRILPIGTDGVCSRKQN